MAQPALKMAGIEINLVNTNGKYTFPNDNFLNGKTILRWWVPDNTEDDGFAPSGANLVPNACIRASIMTIRKDSDAKGLDVQLSYFLQTDGDRRARDLRVDGFNPGTTFINIQDTATFTVGESIVVNVEYLDEC